MNTNKKILKHTIYLKRKKQALQILLKGFVTGEQKKEYKKQLEEVEKEIKVYEYIKTLLLEKENLPF